METKTVVNNLKLLRAYASLQSELTKDRHYMKELTEEIKKEVLNNLPEKLRDYVQSDPDWRKHVNSTYCFILSCLELKWKELSAYIEDQSLFNVKEFASTLAFTESIPGDKDFIMEVILKSLNEGNTKLKALLNIYFQSAIFSQRTLKLIDKSDYFLLDDLQDNFPELCQCCPVNYFENVVLSKKDIIGSVQDLKEIYLQFKAKLVAYYD